MSEFNDNALFNAVERSMLTFNLNNINEICFSQVEKALGSNSYNYSNEKVKILVDNCIDKYFQTFKIVKVNTYNHLQEIKKEI